MHYICLSLLVLLMISNYEAVPTPLRLPGQTQKLTPFIKHWEPANFDRQHLLAAHEKHIIQKHQRRKRALAKGEYAPFHTIRLNFKAHDREFRLVLKQNPLSVFAGDVEIENTAGPISYDTSRVYSGTLEDDEHSHVHAVLTNDNLLDGTIETRSEQYYLEPAHRYSSQLADSGIHSIVYKVSDIAVERPPSLGKTHSTHCASEQLRKKMEQRLENSTEEKQEEKVSKVRQKRWLPDDFSEPSDSQQQQNPPLPLDLEIPYNDAPSLFAPKSKSSSEEQSTESNDAEDEKHIPPRTSTTTTKSSGATRNRNILVNQYNPGMTLDSGDSNNNNNLPPRLYTKHKNIIISTQTFNRTGNHPFNQTSSSSSATSSSSSSSSNQQNDFNNYSHANWSSMFITNTNSNNNNQQNNNSPNFSRPPIHKTHVEIITKNGATKKPNLIVNSYNPELTSNSINPNNNNNNLNNMVLNNWYTGRNLDFDFGQNGQNPFGVGGGNMGRPSYDRKITCMLYLQADHTFFQKMGSDEASIEAITRHVQRANSIYRNTGKLEV